MIPGLTINSLVATEPGIIQELANGHIVTKESVPPGSFTLGTQMAAATMLQVFELLRDGVAVGFFFYSAFKVVSRGGVLVTYLEAKKGKASAASVVLRHPDLVVYDVAGCGSIAVPTLINERISSILSEQ